MSFSKNYYIKRFLGLSLFDKLYILVYLFLKYLQKKMNFKGKYSLYVDNRKNCDNLVIIVAGYQEYTWDIVFDRIKHYLDISADVCIVSSGIYSKKLEQIAEKNKWSYLSLKENKLALAQNFAIEIHPNAQYIYKLDEDIFITKGFFKNLRNKYDLVSKYSQFYPGGITPVININGFTYIKFLETIGKSDDFKKKFNIKGPLKLPLRGEGIDIYNSCDVAKYLRDNALNLDEIQEKYFDSQDINDEYIACSVKYSIGCFLFHRSLYKKMGGWFVTIEKLLGWEEAEYLNYCINSSSPVILCENSFVGHLGFGPQKKEMEKYFKDNKNLFSI